MGQQHDETQYAVNADENDSPREHVLDCWGSGIDTADENSERQGDQPRPPSDGALAADLREQSAEHC